MMPTMRVSRRRTGARAAVLAMGAVAGTWGGVAALAQPAETPPAATGSTYIDSLGCAWQRVEIGDQVSWAALEAEGVQLCGLAPSVSARTAPDTAPDAAPNTAPDRVTATAETTVEQGAQPQTGAQTAPPADAQAAPAGAQAALVEVPPVRKGAPKRPKFPQPGYYVQIGAFSRAQNTDQAIGFLQDAGFGALRATYHGRAPLHVIYAGPFPTAAEAEAARRAAREGGYQDAFVWVPS